MGAGQVDDARRALRVDHHVGRAQVLVQHAAPVQRLQAVRHLLDDGAHFFQRGARVVHHPLRQGLAGHVFQRREQVAARAPGRAGAHHVGAVDAAGHPFVEQEAVEEGRVLVRAGGGGLEHHGLAAGVVDGQVHVAARTHVQRAHDGVALEGHARRERRRQAQAVARQQGAQARCFGQRVDAQQLHGGVVRASVRAGVLAQGAGGGVQVIAMAAQRGVHGGGVEVAVRAVGSQQVEVACLGGPAARVDLDVRVQAQRARQVRPARAHVQAVLFGQRLQRLRVHAADARVAHMQQVQVMPLQDEGAEGADVAAVLVEARRAALVLRVQPGVGGGQHLLRGAAHGPGIGRGVVVLQEAAHRRAAGHLAHAAGADAVGHRQRDAARRAQVARGQHGAVEVLVHAALFGQGVLAEGDLHTARFGAVL